MARKALSKNAENTVLLKCRRRCCICFGLHRDTALKRGQIAHLDKNPSNNQIYNLVFLCLEHHDEYDGRTSQSKNLTIHEIISFRDELYQTIDQVWKQPATFGKIVVDTSISIDGHYIREGIIESSELDIETLSNGIVRVRGFGLWGKTQSRGPNIGELDFESQLIDGKLEFSDRVHDRTYQLIITFEENRIITKEKNFPGYFGLNVSFEGEYIKTSK